MFIVSVNVLFLSNSQLKSILSIRWKSVYRKCQCPLFKQFTTLSHSCDSDIEVFIVSVNVLFLSNSQRADAVAFAVESVYRKCQCPLFKQFTTLLNAGISNTQVFIVSVNVLFLSNSQRASSASTTFLKCLS